MVGARWALLLLLQFGSVSAQAQAAQADTRHWQLEVGFGHESQTAPLFQIAPDTTVIYQDGEQSLRGAHFYSNLQGTAEWLWDRGISTTLSAALLVKRAPTAPGMDMRSLALNPALHVAAGSGGSLGLGVDLQSIEIGGQPFRTVQGVQCDWTHPGPDSLWAVLASTTALRHPGDLQELDARASSVVLLWQLSDPLPALDAVHFSAILGREVNANGFDDLSQHSRMFSASLHGTWAGVQWTLGRSWRRATFEDSLFAGEPARDDQATMTDAGMSWEVRPHQRLRLEANHVRNVSSSAIYNNQYVQYRISWIASF